MMKRQLDTDLYNRQLVRLKYKPTMKNRRPGLPSTVTGSLKAFLKATFISACEPLV